MIAPTGGFVEAVPQRILVIKLSSLGDIVHTLPAVAALRRRFRSAQISWLVKAQWSSILEANSDLDDIVVADTSLRSWLNLVQKLRGGHYDLVVDFQGLFRTGLLGLLSGAKTRVGFAEAREGAPWMYSDVVSLSHGNVSWRLLEIHAVDRNLALVHHIGADTSHPTFHFLDFPEDEHYVDGLLAHYPLADQPRVIALAPWSRSCLKSWPTPCYVELANKLVKKADFRVVLLGGPSDTLQAAEFQDLESQGLLNVVGKLSLRQLPVFLKRMQLVIGNDSSLIHLAASVDVPVLGIFGPTHPKATGPYPGEKHWVLRKDLPCSPCGKQTCDNSRFLECLHTIPPDTVLREIENIFGRN